MNKNICLTAGIALLAGIAVGWIIKPAETVKNKAETEESGRRRKQRIAESGTRVKTVTTVVTNTIQNTVTNTVQVSRNPPPGPGGFMAELERMKDENPERYASMTNRMAQFRRRMMQRTESKLETLAAIDTTGWSKSQIATHEKYQELIARREELMDIIRHDSGASSQERDAAFAELRQIGHELRETSAKERNTLLDKTFQELGYSSSDAKEIRETIKTIYSTTEEWGGHRGGFGRNRR
jgi:membrane-associated HD superfamily phosphohydrolase